MIKPWDEQGAPGALGIWEPLTIISPSLFPCSQVLEDLEEQLYCSAFEEAALTRRICSELQFFPGGMIGMAWARAAPSSLLSALRSHLLLVAFGHGAAAQTGAGSADTEGPTGYVS